MDADADNGRGALTCFLIGPIGDRLAAFGSDERQRHEDAEEFWEYVVAPACAAVGLENPIRADKMSRLGEIPEQAFRLIRDADVVIADLTAGNANVMYELGMRHTLDKITVPLGENERLPFDINVIRTIRFRRTSVGLTEARRELVEALETALGGGFDPVTATRVWHGRARDGSGTGLGPSTVQAADEGNPEFSWTPSSEPEDAQEALGLLDVLADGEVAMSEVAPTVATATMAIQTMSAIAQEIQAEVEASDARGGGMAGRLTVARKLADRLLEPTSELEEAVADYVELVARVDPAIDRLLGAIEADSNASGDEVKRFLISLFVFAHATEKSMASSLELARTYGETGSLSRLLRPVTSRIQRALRRMATTSEVMIQWRARLEALPGWDAEAEAMALLEA